MRLFHKTRCNQAPASNTRRISHIAQTYEKCSAASQAEEIL